MKKKRKCTHWKVTNVRNLLLVIQMMVVLFMSGGRAYGMTDEPLIRLSLKNVLIKDALWEIEKQSKMVFVYNADDLDKAGKINVEVKDKNVREALDACLKGSGFEYVIQQNTVVIKRSVTKTPDVQKLTISGKVVDRDSTPLPGVTVLLKGTNLGVVTDLDGNYSIMIPVVGNPVLSFTFVGMKKEEVNVTGRKVINITLQEEQTAMDEVVVTGIYSRKKESFTGASQTYKAEDLKMVGNHSTTYNGLQNASQLMGTWQRYQDKDVSTEVLTCYGYGDGGGGPTEEMLEQSRRLEHSIVECPAARQTGVKEFFHILEDKMDKKRLAVWDGELYLEFHRGTYTSMAQNKKYNRKAEFKNGETELYAAMASLLDQKYLYPQEQLEHSWKLLLLNQFHDILPGSSIKEVYEDSAAQYEEIFAADEEMMKTAKKSIREKLFRYRAEKNEEVCAVWNPLSFARTALIRNAEGSWQKITAGPSGVTVCRAVNSGEDNCFTELVMEENGRPVSFKTPYFTVRFDANAEITSLVDIREDRELIQKGRMGNRLTVYEDRPAEFDAWNIDEGYLEKSWDVIDVEEFKVLENGPETAALHVRRRFQDSMIEQTIRFYRHTARIDFQTRVDWQEHQQLLRVSFPVDVLAHEADYEIQFGNVKRPTHKNTSWDRARFEVCAHKWADLSEPGYGVALMNDCKYGYDVHEGVMGLTLIKSGIFPNPDADQGQHEFTYALFPHQGDFRKGSVVREAYDLNCPMAWEKVQGIYEDSFSMLQIAEENVMADTVKAAEDGNGIIVRIYETWGMRTKVHVNFPLAPDAQVTVCDCMENFSGVENADMTRVQDGWSFTMKPYEIKTLRIVNEKK